MLHERYLQLTAEICFADKPSGRRVGRVVFAIIDQTYAAIGLKTLLDFLPSYWRNLARELVSNRGSNYQAHIVGIGGDGGLYIQGLRQVKRIL